MSIIDFPVSPQPSDGSHSTEFSRPFDLDKVGKVGAVKTQISATEEEREALAKRMDISKICRFEAIFHLKKAKGLGGGNRGFDAEGSIVAEIIRDDAGSSKDLVETIEFPLKLRLIEGDEETYLKTIDWVAESAKDYDIEFYQNFEVDLGEISAQYLSLELDPFCFMDDLEDESLSPVEEEDKESLNTDSKINPFSILKTLKNKEE